VILEEVAGPRTYAEGDVGIRVFLAQGPQEGGSHDGIADVIRAEDEDTAEGRGCVDGTGAMEEAEAEIERREDEGEGAALVRGVDAHFDNRSLTQIAQIERGCERRCQCAGLFKRLAWE